MPAEDGPTRNESSGVDSACTRCRERKIRCGRERPHCGNCERDGDITCVYQTPAKRVNHLKLLCDSVDRLQDRLTSVESNFARLNDTLAGPAGKNLSPPATVSQPVSRNSPNLEQDSDSDDEDQHLAEDLQGLHVCRSQSEALDYFHGFSSIFFLCNQLRLRILKARESSISNIDIPEVLSKICESAGEMGPFSIAHDHTTTALLPPKEQVLRAMGHFFHHVDYATDIFVEEKFQQNLERCYSEPLHIRDEAWATCFKAVVLLVLGREISLQAPNALFGDFARDLLPSRVALVNTRLLTSPRLINIQALILLSVAAQQFDAVGWSELLFTHACTLARTMGLHHTNLSKRESSPADVETLERSKVLRALYARDKNLCTTRGRMSWIRGDDCSIASGLCMALKSDAPYASRYRLSVLQDEVYELSAPMLHGKVNSQSKVNDRLRSLEQRLQQYARDFNVLEERTVCDKMQIPLSMEFLTTRVVAFRHGRNPRYGQQLLSDSRASCVLLLLACGNEDPSLVAYFNSLVNAEDSPANSSSQPNQPRPRTDDTFFKNILDAFSIQAFFELLNHIMQGITQNDSDFGQISDFDLLRQVSKLYGLYASRLQPGTYHRRTGVIFSQLLAVAETLGSNPQIQGGQACATLSANELQLAPNMSSKLQAHQFSSNAESSLSGSSQPPSLISDASSESVLPNTSLAWDHWLATPAMALPTPACENFTGYSNEICPDFFSQILGTPVPDPSSSNNTAQWTQAIGNTPYSDAIRKRRRISEDSPLMTANRLQSSPGYDDMEFTQEMPFYLIS